MASSLKSLEHACASITLDEEDDDGLIIGCEDIQEREEEYQLALVWKLVIDKPTRFNAMRDTMASVWRLGKGMKATELASNL